MSTKILGLVVCCIIILAVSCTYPVNVGTSTITDSKALPNGFSSQDSFVVIAVKEGGGLLSKQLTEKIEDYLMGKGFSVVSQEESSTAKYSLLFNFSTESREEIISVPKYIPGVTQTTKSDVYGTYGYVGSAKSTTESSGTTVYVPKQITVSATRLAIEVFNLKYLRGLPKEQEPLPIWQGISAVSGSDVRTSIDYLMVAMFKYFGRSTGKNLFFDIYEDDDEIKMLRHQVSMILKELQQNIAAGA